MSDWDIRTSWILCAGSGFYVDKTHFIPEWLASDARITLITRPRRFWQIDAFEYRQDIF